MIRPRVGYCIGVGSWSGVENSSWEWGAEYLRPAVGCVFSIDADTNKTIVNVRSAVKSWSLQWMMVRQGDQWMTTRRRGRRWHSLMAYVSSIRLLDKYLLNAYYIWSTVHAVSDINKRKILSLLQRAYNLLPINVNNIERHLLIQALFMILVCDECNTRPWRTQRLMDLAFKEFIVWGRDKEQHRKL